MTRWRENYPKAGDNEKPLLEAVLAHYGVPTPRQVFMARCIFHRDDSPSLSVNLNMQVWRCHSCSRGGDSYTLIMEKEDCNFQRARAIVTDNGIAQGSLRASGDDLREGRWQRRPVPSESRDRQEPSRWRSPRSRDE